MINKFMHLFQLAYLPIVIYGPALALNQGKAKWYINLI